MLAANTSTQNVSSFFVPPVRTVLHYDDLSDSGLVLLPQSAHNSIEPAPFHDAFWHLEDIAKPKKPTIIGNIDPERLANSPWFYNVGGFIVKPHNSDQLFLPKELDTLLPFAQKVLNYEFACNAKSALERTAFLLVESSSAQPGEPFRSHAGNLHAHCPSTNPRYASKSVRYYVTATRDTTLFYTGAIAREDISTNGFLIKSEENYPPDYRAQPGDIIAFTSIHPHKTATETTAAAAPRVFVTLGFMDAYASQESKTPNPMIERMRMHGRSSSFQPS